MPQHKRHPLNAPGDFYVEDGCCVACLVPFEAVPELLRYDEEASHCYVCQQPRSLQEQQLMADAVGLSEVRCIRYSGKDEQVLNLLSAKGELDQCDQDQRNLIQEQKTNASASDVMATVAKRVWRLWARK
jgi:hypothetical protein